MSTNELRTRFAVEFFVLRVAQDKKAKDFFTDELHMYKGRKYKKPRKPLSPPGLVCRREEKRKTKEGGLLPHEGDLKKRKRKRKRPRKARRWLREGKVPCVLNQDFFFWFTSIRVLGDPSHLKYWLLRHFYTRKPCAKEIPETDYFTQQKQYLKRTTLRPY